MSKAPSQPLGYYSESACDIDEFTALVTRRVAQDDIALASSAPKNIPVYDMNALSAHLSNPALRRTLMTEWATILQHGAGVFVLQNACPDLEAIDAATSVYQDIIAEEKAHSGGGADHFAAAGSNDRIWNSLQKLCERAPQTFARYFAAPAVDAACEAWLGPNYQMTAQVNLVHPGGQAQQAHRDYHLGFQSAEVSATYPAHVHDLSPLMTLQGGIAHCDISIESGPTKLLPFSQNYRPGYAAWRRDDFRAYFEQHYVQLPLKKGDALFFSPALFHAAGSNISADVHRMVNLLQVSSPFGRAMESVDRTSMCAALYSSLQKNWDAGGLCEQALNAVIAATAEGYSFPTNLDKDPPIGGLAPQTQQALLKESLLKQRTHSDFVALMQAQNARREA